MTRADLPDRIIFLDPGKATGWAQWLTASRHFQSGILEQLPLGEMLCRRLDARTWVGWEAFTIRPGSGRMSQRGEALEVIGTVKWIAYFNSATVLPEQQPGDKILGLRHLKPLGWHRPGPDHADSAAAHLLTFLLSRQLIPSELLSKVMKEEEREEGEECRM